MIRRIAIATFVVALPVLAAAGASAGPNDSNCFGQGRSGYASGSQPLGSVGSIVSDRAHTDVAGSPNGNVAANRAYKASC